MSLVFTVFLPNKTRYRLEISKFTPLYQGLEKVCTDKGYLPAHCFTFRYNKTYPDLGTPVGMLGLSNLTELELVPSSEAPGLPRNSGSAAAADTVTVALQYGSQRHSEAFQCDTSLLDAVCQFAQKHPDWIPSDQSLPPDHLPVIVHMRQEVPGSAALSGTSLRQLGLQPGGPPALLRLLHRQVPQEKLLAAEREVASRRQAAEAAAAAATKSPTPAPTPVSAQTVSAAPDVVAPSQATHGRPAAHASAGASEFAPDPGAGASLFSPFRELPVVRPPPKQPAKREPRTLAEALNLPSFDDFQRQQQQHQQPPPPPAFGPERPFRFPEETAGMDLYRNELAEVRAAEFAACDRRVCVYAAGAGASATVAAAATSTASAGQLEEPDDEFFNLTESDMRRLMADLKRKVDEETNGPMLTRQQREQRREDLYSAYEYSVIRLFFPDRRVVQAAFRPRETVFALHRFVQQELLANQEADFFLYTTPPKNEITDMAQFLIHADLVPMPIVHVGFRTPHSLEGQEILKPEIAALVSDRQNCDRIALDCMRSAVAPIYASQQEQQQHRSSQQPPRAAATASGHGNATVPKWFKK